MDEAARVELDALHSQVSEWRRQMTPDEWKALHVVVMGAHMPRDSEITMQYFQRLLDEPIEGRRIIFAEGLWEEPRALDLLGTHLVDGNAALRSLENSCACIVICCRMRQEFIFKTVF